MSHDLPARPDLEFLRKQAKRLLDNLRRSNADAKLADAQHALAREYGFASWPKFKLHVERTRVAVVEHPFAGRWIADLARSSAHPDHPFQHAMVHFEISGDLVTIVDTVVDATGPEDHVNRIRVDGLEHPSPNGHGYSVIATWRGSRVLETVARKDGRVVGVGRYEVSEDGRTLTMSGDQMSVVFDRAQDV